MFLRFVVFRERSGALRSENNQGKPQPKNLTSEKKNKKKRKTHKHSKQQPNEHIINPTKRTAKKAHEKKPKEETLY